MLLAGTLLCFRTHYELRGVVSSAWSPDTITRKTALASSMKGDVLPATPVTLVWNIAWVGMGRTVRTASDLLAQRAVTQHRPELSWSATEATRFNSAEVLRRFLVDRNHDLICQLQQRGLVQGLTSSSRSSTSSCLERCMMSSIKHMGVNSGITISIG